VNLPKPGADGSMRCRSSTACDDDEDDAGSSTACDDDEDDAGSSTAGDDDEDDAGLSSILAASAASEFKRKAKERQYVTMLKSETVNEGIGKIGNDGS